MLISETCLKWVELFFPPILPTKDRILVFSPILLGGRSHFAIQVKEILPDWRSSLLAVKGEAVEQVNQLASGSMLQKFLRRYKKECRSMCHRLFIQTAANGSPSPHGQGQYSNQLHIHVSIPSTAQSDVNRTTAQFTLKLHFFVGKY